MTNNLTRVRFRTAAALKADAGLLAGDRSRVAQANADTGEAATENGTVGELWLYGVVGGWWRGFDAESVANSLRGLDVDTLYVRVHSPGGHASDGVAISNLLRNHRAKVVIVVDGLAASAASVIATAGDEIVMCPGSQLMLHDASMGTYGNEAQLRRDADWIGKQSENYAGIYAHKAGGTVAAWREVMLANDGEGTWYTADEAVAAGLADEVGTRTATSSPPVAPEDEIDDGLLASVEHDLQILEQAVHPAARAAWQGEQRTPKPPAASASGSVTTPEGEPAMAFTSEQLTQMRKDLGLQADADEATIVAALSEAASSAEIAPPTTPQVPEGMALVDSGVLAQLQAGATAGQAAADTLAKQEREAAFNDALRAGKLSADTAKNLRAKVEEKPETWAATKALLDALTPGLVPTAEIGHGDEPKATADDALYASVFGDDKKGA